MAPAVPYKSSKNNKNCGNGEKYKQSQTCVYSGS